MAMPQQKIEELARVEMSPDFDKMFDADLNAVTGGMYRRQMTVEECERLIGKE
ncbi:MULTISPECIES: hypothetical protein [Paenibacillaceae]|uniref:Uncharacterized protein n=1 Tax=Aneurinibacillus danicus TaxID=267746 RepID=A0A511V7C3_9BACL|nr:MULTISPECIES: hypothetical protein [Paenibacillaceae]GEN33838.1 hypothetical protein ADA01nite_12980 [Aneurinibacillus danicus]